MPSKRRPCLRVALISAVLSSVTMFSVSPTYAQSRSLFGDRGPAGQIGSNLTGSMVGQGTTFGSNNGANSVAQPLTGAVGNTALSGLPQGTNSGFVGRGNNGRFVGDQRLGQQTTSPNRSTAASNLGNRSSQRNGTTFESDRSVGNRATSVRIIRPRQKIAFDFPRHKGDSISSDLKSRFQQLSVPHRHFSQIQVSVDEKGLATLVGSVDSAATARLAVMMTRQEPGVRDVQNELTVSQDEE